MKACSTKETKKRTMRGRRTGFRKVLSQLIREMIRRNVVSIKFCIRFIVLLSVFVAVIIVMRIGGQRVETSMNSFTAKTTAYVLEALSLETRQYHSEIDAQGLTFDIIIECTGLYTACLYLSCVLAFPASFKRKIAGSILGLLAIFTVNIFRLTTLILIAIYRPQLSDLAHYYIWDVSFIVLVIVLFQIWVDGIVKGTADKLIFLAKFLAYSIALFLFIVYVLKGPYQNLLTNIVQMFFERKRHFDQDNVPLIANRIYNLVTFVSLMLATSRMPWPKRTKYTAIGLLIIFIYHCILSLSANFQSFQDLSGVYRVNLESITLIVYFALPLLLWISFTYRYTFRRMRATKTDVTIPDDISVCPYCAKRKRGLAEHMRTVHGQERSE